jgi:hypothetical protein
VIETRVDGSQKHPGRAAPSPGDCGRTRTVHSSSPWFSRFVMATPAVRGASHQFTAGPSRARRKEAMPAQDHVGLAGAVVGCPISPQGEVALPGSAIRPNHRGDSDRRSEIDPRGALPVVGGRCHICRHARRRPARNAAGKPGGRNHQVRPTLWHRLPPFRLPQSASPWPRWDDSDAAIAAAAVGPKGSAGCEPGGSDRARRDKCGERSRWDVCGTGDQGR